MKNKLQKQLIVTGLLVSAMAVSFPANGITENVCAAESTESSENEEEMEAEREVRHNFKHQLAALKGFLETGNTEELRQYCDTLENQLLNIAEIPYTGNAAADGVLYHYACIAKEENISFEVCCRLDKLSISDTDLCCLLGNVLDNAVTACGK